MSGVRIEKLVKRCGDIPLVHGIDLDIAQQAFIGLIGPSGYGKSTTLGMVAALEEPSDGRVRIAQRAVNDVAPKDHRDVAMPELGTPARTRHVPCPLASPLRVVHFLDDRGHDCDPYVSEAHERSFKIRLQALAKA